MNRKSMWEINRDGFIDLSQRVLKKKYPNEYQEMIEQMKISFAKHMTELSKFENDNGKKHAMNVYFIISLYESLKLKGIENGLKEISMKVFKDLVGSLYNIQVKRMKKSKDPWNCYTDYVKNGNEVMYGEPYFKIDELICDDEKIEFKIKKCTYHELFKKLGYEHISTILCEYDYIGADYFKKWMKFERDCTIASGCKCCNFKYKKLEW